MAYSKSGDVARSLGIAAMAMVRRDLTDRQLRALEQIKKRNQERNGKK